MVTVRNRRIFTTKVNINSIWLLGCWNFQISSQRTAAPFTSCHDDNCFSHFASNYHHFDISFFCATTLFQWESWLEAHRITKLLVFHFSSFWFLILFLTIMCGARDFVALLLVLSVSTQHLIFIIESIRSCTSSTSPSVCVQGDVIPEGDEKIIFIHLICCCFFLCATYARSRIPKVHITD